MRSRSRLGFVVLAGCLASCSHTCSRKQPAADDDPSSPIATSSETSGPTSAAAPIHVTLPKTPWPVNQQALHVLNRLAFGPRPGEIEAVAKAGVAAWIGAQLRPVAVADTAVEARLRAMPALTMSIGALHETYPQPKAAAKAAASAAASAVPSMMPSIPVAPQGPVNDMTPPGTATETPKDMIRQLVAQKILRAVASERQLQEVLVDFWFNHFNVTVEKGQVKWYAIPYERDAIRPHVFGRFRDLLGATAHHPAMLFYLDNWQSVGADRAHDGGTAKPQGLNENYGRELLELHTLGVDGGYSQNDVTETARAFTGWSIEQPNRDAAFTFHPKKHDQEEKHLLGKVIKDGGQKDGEHVLDLLVASPATARFVASALCQKFHSDHPPEALVKRVADVFSRSGGDLTRVYEAIFTAPEFWSDAAFRTKTKTPLELVASALRAVGAQTDDAEPVSREIDKLGEPLYHCAPPTGYKETADAWVSTGGLLARINFGVTLAGGRIKGTTFDREKLAGTPFPTEEGALVDRLADSVLHTPLSPASRAVIVKELEHADPYQEPSPTTLPLALGLILGSPEMQKQ